MTTATPPEVETPEQPVHLVPSARKAQRAADRPPVPPVEFGEAPPVLVNVWSARAASQKWKTSGDPIIMGERVPADTLPSDLAKFLSVGLVIAVPLDMVLDPSGVEFKARREAAAQRELANSIAQLASAERERAAARQDDLDRLVEVARQIALHEEGITWGAQRVSDIMLVLRKQRELLDDQCEVIRAEAERAVLKALEPAELLEEAYHQLLMRAITETRLAGANEALAPYGDDGSGETHVIDPLMDGRAAPSPLDGDLDVPEERRIMPEGLLEPAPPDTEGPVLDTAPTQDVEELDQIDQEYALSNDDASGDDD